MCEMIDGVWRLCRQCPKCGEDRRPEFWRRLDGLQAMCAVCQDAASRSRKRAADRRLPVDGATRRKIPASYSPEARLHQAFANDFRRWLSGDPIVYPEWLAEYERLGPPQGEWGRGFGKIVLGGDFPYRWMLWEEACHGQHQD